MCPAIHTLKSTSVSPLERIFEVPFDLQHNGTTTHAGSWLLKELEFSCDDTVCEITGQRQLRVKLQGGRLALECIAHSFEVVEGIINAAWHQDREHKAIDKIVARDLV